MALSIAYAERLVGDKKLLEAKAICRQLKGAGNNTLRVEFLLGSIALLEGNFVTALEVFAPLAKKYPQHAGVLNNIATAIQHTGGSVEDIECLIERSLELDPKTVMVSTLADSIAREAVSRSVPDAALPYDYVRTYMNDALWIDPAPKPAR